MPFKKKLNEAEQFAEQIIDKGKNLAFQSALKADDFAEHALAASKAVATEAKELVLHKSLDSKRTAEVGFWAGLSSLVLGFPANVIAIVSGHTIEDRRRASASGAYKVAAKALVPSDSDVKKSRVGLIAGYSSIVLGLVAFAALAHAKKK